MNPFLPAIAASPAVERQQAAERVGQARRQQDVVRNSGLHGKDVFEHQVESTDTLAGAGDDEGSSQGRYSHERESSKEKSTDEDEKPSIDLTA